MRKALNSLIIIGFLAGCGEVSAPIVSPEPKLVQSYEAPPQGADPASCWGKDVTPAVIETVTERTLVQPAEVQDDGSVITEPVYRQMTRQRIVKEREELWFETPCPDQYTPDIITSLQRALKARGHYRGALTGEMDAATRGAVRAYQVPQGLDSSILSLAAAQKLGLVAFGRNASGG